MSDATAGLAAELATRVLATARAMNASGINSGSAGNVSARCEGGFIITPTGMAYDDCTAADMVKVGADALCVPGIPLCGQVTAAGANTRQAGGGSSMP